MAGNWKWFNEKEDPKIVGVEPEMISKADFARSKSGIPFIVTSGLRNIEENIKVKGGLKSSHLPNANGLAMGMDFACSNDHELWSMLFGLYMAGFRRMGIYFTRCSNNPTKLIPTHIHADIMDDPAHPIEILWSELEQN